MAANAAALAPARPETDRAAINRANSLLSTGPRTDEGKAASSRNNTRHGLFVSLDAMPPAERAYVQEIYARLPYSHTNDRYLQDLALDLASLIYRRERVRSLEFATISDGVREICEAEGISEPEDTYHRARLEARVFKSDFAGPRLLARFNTYERGFNREIDKATKRIHEHVQAEEARLMAQVDMLELGIGPNPGALPRIDPNHRFPSVASYFQNENTPRNADCPCGSGEKYKRCCGKNAPPVLNHGAA